MLRQLVPQELTTKAIKNVFDSCFDRFASVIISKALNLTGGDRSRAVKLLSLSRLSLHSKIQKHGLKLEISVQENAPSPETSQPTAIHFTVCKKI